MERLGNTLISTTVQISYWSFIKSINLLIIVSFYSSMYAMAPEFASVVMGP
jgi:hypothetical protein